MRMLCVAGQAAGALKPFTLGVSFGPLASGADHRSDPRDRPYVVASGELTVATSDGEAVLSPLDAESLAVCEGRLLMTRANRLALSPVVVSEAG